MTDELEISFDHLKGNNEIIYMEDERPSDSRIAYWWSGIGIFISIVIFIFSLEVNNLQFKNLERSVVASQFAEKNDVINSMSGFITTGLLKVPPDIFRQAYESALLLDSDFMITRQELDGKVYKINNLEDYLNAVTVEGSLKRGMEAYNQTFVKIQNLQNYINLAFLLLIISQIIGAKITLRSLK